MRATAWFVCVIAVVAAAGVSSPRAQGGGDRQRRLERIRGEIARLESEMEGLASRETTTLGEIDRLSAEIGLREAELAENAIRLEGISSEIARQDRRIEELAAAQDERRGYLAFRLRELYKRGPVSDLRRLVGGRELDAYLPALRYATYLSERDVRILGQYRIAAAEIGREREVLREEHARLDAARAEGERMRRRLGSSRERHGWALEGIRTDRRRRSEALLELETASDALSRLVAGLPSSAPLIDVRKFRGLLDWPAAGVVSAEFGNVVHPRFKTVVPHPGLDIDSPSGQTFRAVFEGRVLLASWLHGYGLTVIVDHGHGVVSIYAHASALVVERGEAVVVGQLLGRVGETGSLRGPYLYFEIREQGAAVDPRTWLRDR